MAFRDTIRIPLRWILLSVFLVCATSLWGAEPQPLFNEEHLASIDELVDKGISEGKMPGAVVLIGNRDGIVYRKAFGYRAVEPTRIPMTVDTIFDISSMTKAIATTTAIMQLVEHGKCRLEDSVGKYWPEFKPQGKAKITIRQLLTHYSGLSAGLSLTPYWSGHDAAMKMIINETPMYTPGTHFTYSDINFEVLGELVFRLSGQRLDAYCTQHIFKPLGMKDTSFRPSEELRSRIAPTQYRKGKLLQGEAHDLSAYRMAGVAGHAGVFSTADDLAIFARMILHGGTLNGVRILGPLTIAKMFTPQEPLDKKTVRGLGWDMDSPFASNRGVLFPVGSYGHSGYTGTSIWIDPTSETYVIILSNRVHPAGGGDVVSLRAEIATIVGAALEMEPAQRILKSRKPLTAYHELVNSYHTKGPRNGKVKTGIDVLVADGFASLSGLNVGLITNHSGIDSKGLRSVDLLHRARSVKLKAIFSPEHGFSGEYDEIIKTDVSTDPGTGVPIYNLYGKTYRPTPAMLAGLDALVFDIQDAGVRFYTYITTMAYAMEAAAAKGIAFYVLDRPNPINAMFLQGPVVQSNLRSFTNYFPMPIRHAMTIGELALMFNEQYKIGLRLHVVKMQGYERTDWYDETGLKWINPSPNIRTLTQATLYPAVALVEGANVSVGRGTDMPFEVMGAPWMDAKRLAAYLNGRRIQGVRFLPVDFKPKGEIYANEVCRGVQIVLVDRQELDSALMGVEIVSALYNLFPGFQVNSTKGLIGESTLQSIKQNTDPQLIALQWQEELRQFQQLRAKYLLY
ncbi:Uncharacterized conserved protein UCP016719 [Candidatus Magnetobacterium bavaricum]|uniref:Uncharacterized conserved protein UCP016719 n=1 Tax=Candidatus Magnetobacterium bavaricum TaxID=29290 RepID=A0A0F3GVN7_9BACT|nr:Uncharacterized conserved protein UCP016719 [Candidatus Magnetobacterium bavaricum]